MGQDLDPTSPTYGLTYQISYAMSKVIGGPNGMRLGTISEGSGTSKVMLAWEHDNQPGCSDTGGIPVYPFTSDVAQHHYPVARHEGVFHIVFCDGHVVPLGQEDLAWQGFYATPQTTGP